MNTERGNESFSKSLQSSRAERVLGWRKYISTLSEENFFDIIRIYLGEVHTPYNKQDLVEELSAFIRKDENKQKILRLLSGIDLKLLAAIRFIPSACIDKLETFFSPALSEKQISLHIDNLIQRLLVYYAKDEEKKKEYLCLNPLLEDKLSDLLDIDILLPSYQGQENTKPAAEAMDDGKIAALMSYILAHPDLCKADGNLKKKNAEEIAEKIGDVAQMQVLLNSLRNLGIFIEEDGGKKIISDWDKADSFALLDRPTQKAYLCAANIGHLSRNSLYESAQLLFDTMQCVKNKHYGREALLRLSFLIKQNARESGTSAGPSGRFQKLIASASLEGACEDGETEEGMMAAALDAAIAFGYVCQEGEDGEGEAIYCVNPVFFESLTDQTQHLQDSVNIDAAFCFMVMPGLSLQNFIPLIKFLEIVKYDKVLSFEINKKAAMRSFDFGLTAKTIKETIASYCAYPIPQNLDVTLDEWFSSYSSASLYKGYVLKVSGENELRIRKNPFLASHIIETLAPGLYLLDFTDDSVAQSAIKHCGLDFIGKIKTKETDRSVSNFYRLREHSNILSYTASGDTKQRELADERKLRLEQDKLIASLKEKVDAMQISQEQKEGLFSRIDRRVIISEEQLRPESVRFEKLEAFGMDYQGKMHVIENAISAKSLVEITNGEEDDGFLGEVTAFNKYEGEAEVTLKDEAGAEKTFSVSRASLVRKVIRPISF